jgi:hypothetical protein
MPRQPLHGSGTKAGTHLSRSVLRHGARGLARHTSLAQKAALSVIDKALVSTGVLTAVVSASFATYMVSTDHPHPTFGGIEHLMIFAQPSLGYPRAAIATVEGTPVERSGIDYGATGTIPPKPPASSGVFASDFPEPIVSTYMLHDVHDGAAIVVGKDDNVYQVERGSVLPGVGRVLAISQRGGKWIVVTEQGLITDGLF